MLHEDRGRCGFESKWGSAVLHPHFILVNLPALSAGIDISLLTAVLGALVLGIGTEFIILLMERYLEEANGMDTEAAIIMTITKAGRANSALGLQSWVASAPCCFPTLRL